MVGVTEKSEPANVSKRRYGPTRLVYAGTALLILVLLAANAAVITQLRESELQHEENHLKNLALTLAEQAGRTFQSVDLVLSSVTERMAAEGVVDEASFVQNVTRNDFHLLLREKISGVPQLDAVTLISGEGKQIGRAHV